MCCLSGEIPGALIGPHTKKGAYNAAFGGITPPPPPLRVIKPPKRALAPPPPLRGPPRPINTEGYPHFGQEGLCPPPPPQIGSRDQNKPKLSHLSSSAQKHDARNKLQCQEMSVCNSMYSRCLWSHHSASYHMNRNATCHNTYEYHRPHSASIMTVHCAAAHLCTERELSRSQTWTSLCMRMCTHVYIQDRTFWKSVGKGLCMGHGRDM